MDIVSCIIHAYEKCVWGGSWLLDTVVVPSTHRELWMVTISVSLFPNRPLLCPIPGYLEIFCMPVNWDPKWPKSMPLPSPAQTPFCSPVRLHLLDAATHGLTQLAWHSNLTPSCCRSSLHGLVLLLPSTAFYGNSSLASLTSFVTAQIRTSPDSGSRGSSPKPGTQSCIPSIEPWMPVPSSGQ